MSTPEDKITYTVHARRWAHGWELHVDGVGVTQSRTLNDAEAMVRDYIALDTGADPASFSVEILPLVDERLDSETRAARRAVIDAETAQRTAATLSRNAARKLRDAGLTGREIAVVLKISPQRVSQLLRSRHHKSETVSLHVLFVANARISGDASVVIARDIAVHDRGKRGDESVHPKETKRD